MTGPYYQPIPSPPGGARHPFRWVMIGIATVFGALAVFVGLILLFPSTFGFSSPPVGYRGPGFGGIFLVFFLFLVFFFLLRVAFWGVRWGRYGGRYGRYGPDGRHGPARPAMVAQMRYARGEISREQYQQIIQDLGRDPRFP